MQRTNGRTIGRILLCATALFATSVAPLRVAAQVPATPPLPPAHWAYIALDRLAGAGLLDDAWAVGNRPQSAGVALAAFRTAVVRAALEGSPLAGFARSAARRFAREHPQSHRSATTGAYLAVREARLRAGKTTGAPARRGRLEFGVDVTAALGRHFVVSYGPAVSMSASATTVEQPRLAVVGKVGSWWASAGRQRLSFGPATGGLILNDASAFDGLLFGSDGAVRLGGIGHWLGPVHVTALISRIAPDTLGEAAWFGAARVTFAPHPRVHIGLNRTAVVPAGGGDGVGLGSLLLVAVGKHTRPNKEDQRASVDLSVALGGPSWRVVPYLEWGFEDTAGAYMEDPGLTVGAYMPFLPGVPTLSLRYEYTGFGESARLCWFCSARITKWYRHGTVRSAYIGEDGLLIGHPLGGYGYEHRIDAVAWLVGADARVRATLVRRHREPLNLLYATRPGDSHALGAGGSYRVGPALTFDANLWWEQGEAGWHNGAASIGGHLLF